MKPLSLLLLTLITACVPVEPWVYIPTHTNIAAVGDSMCDGKGEWPQVAGIVQDCVSGRASGDLEAMPSDMDIIFYGLITNDAWQLVEVEQYRANIQYHLSQVDSRVVCLLPSPVFEEEESNIRLEELKQVMTEECNETIGMKEHGFLHGGIDGIHPWADDSLDFGNYIKQWIRGDL